MTNRSLKNYFIQAFFSILGNCSMKVSKSCCPRKTFCWRFFYFWLINNQGFVSNFCLYENVLAYYPMSFFLVNSFLNYQKSPNGVYNIWYIIYRILVLTVYHIPKVRTGRTMGQTNVFVSVLWPHTGYRYQIKWSEW